MHRAQTCAIVAWYADVATSRRLDAALSVEDATMTPDMDDAALVKSALDGDHQAFGELVRRYRDAALGTSTGYEAFLRPGSGTFELYAHVLEAAAGGERVLTILMPDEESQIRIHLEGEDTTAYTSTPVEK